MHAPLRLSPYPVIAELGNDRCAALGIIGRGEAPALDLCRKLVGLGIDPATPLHVYRGDVLALRIRSIGEGAQLRVTTNTEGTPVFGRYAPAPAAAPPVTPAAATLAETHPDEITARSPATAGAHGTYGGRP